ncbi:MAG: hypothetical protein GYA51_08925 [Candidatus Methanofastidiosa archaeon]|nr:hypothetical protein [Candidatus Methanofastidiosa archaeon]
MTNINAKQRIRDLLTILEESNSVEEDTKSIELYDFHIKLTKSLLEKLDKIDPSETISYLTEYFINESNAYERSYLPNKNGEKAENHFWRLKRELNL